MRDQTIQSFSHSVIHSLIMKRTSINIILFIAALWLISCNQENKQELSTKKAVYKQALKNSDYNVATQAIYDIMAMQRSETHWRDSLALIYIQQKSYRQAITVSQQQLAENPDDTLMVKVQALAYKSLNEPKNALAAYEKLYPLTQDIYHLYEIATLQYNMTRLQECMQTAKGILAHPKVKEASVSLAFNRQNQTVPLKAAVLNLQGVVAKDLDKKKEATAFFEQALLLFPDFELAKGNLEAI